MRRVSRAPHAVSSSAFTALSSDIIATACTTGSKRGRWGAADLTAGRIGGDEVGKLLVEGEELAHHGVPLAVGDLGRVELVVELVVVANALSEMLHTLRGVDGLGHGGHPTGGV